MEMQKQQDQSGQALPLWPMMRVPLR